MKEYWLGVTTATIQIFPEDGYFSGKKISRTLTRAGNGSLFDYIAGTYLSIKIPVKCMPSSDAAQVNSWWADQTQLVFLEVWSATTVYSCMISGNAQPLDSMSEPNDGLYEGDIMLEGY